MTTFVDSNVPMYLIGADHPNKPRAISRLNELVATGERLVTSAEVYQEILHRYSAIHRVDAIQPAFDALRSVVDECYPIDADDVEAAKTVVQGDWGLSARDALHVAVMRRHRVSRVLSFDRDLDRYPGISRIE